MRELDARTIGVLVFVFVLGAGLFVRAILGRRLSADDLERSRRDRVLRIGKISDGEITEVNGTAITYQYSVAGVVYVAMQDLAAFVPRLPSGLVGHVGPVSIRFDPRNPANSIVISDQWSGLRVAPGSVPTTTAGESG